MCVSYFRHVATEWPLGNSDLTAGCDQCDRKALHVRRLEDGVCTVRGECNSRRVDTMTTPALRLQN